MGVSKWIDKVDPQCLTAFEKRFPGAFKVVSDGLAEDIEGRFTPEDEKYLSSLRGFTTCARMLQTYWTGWVDAKEEAED